MQCIESTVRSTAGAPEPVPFTPSGRRSISRGRVSCDPHPVPAGESRSARANSSAMHMSMVDIRIMRVLVHQHLMPMRVRVRDVRVPLELVRVLMVFIVPMAVAVLEGFVRMLVLMPLAQMQPDTDGHHHGCHPEEQARRLRPERQRDEHTE